MTSAYLKHPNLRFGWHQAGHHAIDAAAIRSLKEVSSPELKRWGEQLEAGLNTIQQIDSEQDVFHKGPAHFINLDSPPSPLVSIFQTTTASPPKTWAAVKEHFSPAVLARLTQVDFESVLPDQNSQNVINAIQTRYQKLVATLQQEKPTLQSSSNPSLQTLKTIGELAHYVGDLCMPLHTTQWFDWPVFPTLQAQLKPQNSLPAMHEWLESIPLNTPASNNSTMKNAANLTLTPQAVPNLLADHLKQSYLSLFKLVNAQQIAFKTDVASPANTPTLVPQESLQQEWQFLNLCKPLLAEQQQRASELLNTLLQSAFNTSIVANKSS